MADNRKGYRAERDTLGRRWVPEAAYYGVQTLRAAENFPISGIRPKRAFIKATGLVKLASAEANVRLSMLDKKRGHAIRKASLEVVSGRFDPEFIVDVYQAGAGTSHNMNANEVIANRAIEIMGGARGDYSIVHPNDHVNMSQSTNDTMPTALRLAALISGEGLVIALGALESALRRKSREFDGVIKSGRTHLQDAVPVRLGQEFGSYASAVGGASRRVTEAAEGLKNIGLGATAAGTGINTHPRYSDTVLKSLSRASGMKDLRKAPDTFEAINSMADFAHYSGALRCAAVELIRIANDFRLLASGPATGLAEIRLPAVQPGSSIMPGKVNPVMAEMLDMVCFQVIGNDLAVVMAAQAGQLELNVMLPLINYNILQSVEILTNAVTAFTQRCVEGIEADVERCRDYFERSAGLATVLNRIIGYEKAATVARESARTGRTVKEVVIGRGILTEAEWERLMDPMSITAPGRMRAARRRG